MIYRALRFLFRLAVHVFFRRIEVAGLENVPAAGPVIFAANHANALVDPVVFLVRLRRPLTLTARSTLARIPAMRVLLRLANVIPLERAQDAGKGAELRKNVAALAEARRRLEGGAALCIFPEGQSHSDPHLRSFHTGAARLALDCEAGAGPPVRIVPVGLHYAEKDRFRSDVWVRFGEPIDVAAWRAAHPGARHRELTAEIEARVRSVTLNFERRADSAILDWTAGLLATGGMPPAPVGRDEEVYRDRVALVERLLDGYESLRRSRPEEVGAVRRRVRAYRSELRRLGVAPREVWVSMAAWRAAWFVVRELLVFLLAFPLAAWGVVFHLAPALVVRGIARRLSTKKDQWASNVVFPSVVVFPAWYALALAAGWILLAPLAAAVWTVSIPLGGIAALSYLDRAGGALRRARTFLLFLFRPGLRRRLADEGRAIIEEIRRLGELVEAARADAPGRAAGAGTGQESGGDRAAGPGGALALP